MFMFRAHRYLEELEKFCPDILRFCKTAVENGVKDLDFFRLDETSFGAISAESVDYAVMEKTDRAVVVPLDAGWNDIGSWSALWDIDEKDEYNNAKKGDLMLHDTTECLVHAESRLVTTVGINNIVVIETKDAVLVADKSQVKNVKVIVDNLSATERTEDQMHRAVYRPWGCFDSIDEADRFKIKRITVKPGAKLSLQMHHHRAEHWVVVSGTAKVTKGEKTVMLSENESTYIEVGEIHALENPGVVPLEIIEVQTGNYLGEDDIIRLDDLYGRGEP
jgi:mannose-1-phosphate guanylyltransferase